MKVLLVLLAVIVRSAYGYSTRDYINYWDRPVNFYCKNGLAIGQITSIFRQVSKDRRWDMTCHYVAATKECEYTSYKNQFNEDFEFDCPNNKSAIVGISSYHQNRHEDRRFKFKCCTVPILDVNSCLTTEYVNDYHIRMNLKLDFDEVITGIYSYINVKEHDRLWKMKICKLNVFV